MMKVPKQRNLFRVQKKQWAKWSELERRMFNDLYHQMQDQRLFSHPQAPQCTKAQWRTVAWNAAWMAADNLRAARREFA